MHQPIRTLADLELTNKLTNKSEITALQIRTFSLFILNFNNKKKKVFSDKLFHLYSFLRSFNF